MTPVEILVCPVCQEQFPRRNRLKQRPGMPCPSCRRRLSDETKRRQRLDAGLCRTCGQPARTGKATCQACCDAAVERNRRRREQRAAQGEGGSGV